MSEEITYKVFGTAMHKVALTYINEWAERIADSEDTSETVRKATRLSFFDASDLYSIGTLIKKGQVNQARNLAYSLDTIVRDEIPQNIWDFLNGRADL